MALTAVLAGPLNSGPHAGPGPGFDLPTAAGASMVVIAVSSGATLAARGRRRRGTPSPQRLSTAFTVLIVIVAGYTLTRSLPSLA